MTKSPAGKRYKLLFFYLKRETVNCRTISYDICYRTSLPLIIVILFLSCSILLSLLWSSIFIYNLSSAENPVEL